MTGRIFGLAAALAISASAQNLIPAGAWTAWSPRPALAADTRSSEGVLTLRARSFESFGKWITVARPVVGGKTYRFSAQYLPTSITSEDTSVVAILSWCKDADGKTPIQRDYADRADSDSQWRRMKRTLTAPAGTQSLRVELALRWTEFGAVDWKNVEVVETQTPKPRLARVVTTHLKPAGTVKGNVELMARALDAAAKHRPDLVVLSENFVDRGAPGGLEQTSEPIPGPATNTLAQKARQHRTWIVTTMHEIDKPFIYNTAVVIDREGRIAGKYRKVHLATAEGEAGVTPGSEYAVFDTDFGRMGVLTCWDNWFVETARILRAKGAEMLVLPIAGDGVPGHWDVISRARAIDNGVYLVSSNTVGESSSRIVAPTGKVLAETLEPLGIAFAEVDLDAVERVNWLSVGPALGDPRNIYMNERRPETYGALTRDIRTLKISTDFEGGNLESSEVISSNHVRGNVRAESDQNRRNRQPSWFYFRLDGAAGRDLTIDLTGFRGEYNFKPTDGQWAGRMRPFYSYDNRTWHTFDTTEWDKEAVRLRLRLKATGDTVWVARIPPYTNRHLDRLLARVAEHPHFRQESIGNTPQGRPMHLLTITNPSAPDAGKKVLWLMARQHSWEAGTSWVAQGALEWLLSADPAAVSMRDQFVVKMLPMCDPDGVARGGVRFNAHGYDLNRNWDGVDPAFMPEIAAQRKAILDWVDSGRRIDIYLALHNDESDDYVEGPLVAGGSAVESLGHRFWKLLDSTTSFDSPKGPRNMPATTTAGMKGRMTVYQGLFADRKIPAFLMELKTERNPKLGREATMDDRLAFGAGLIRAMAGAVTGQP